MYWWRSWRTGLSNEDLCELGLCRLPVDADNKPWHVGDAGTYDDYDFTVSAFIYDCCGGSLDWWIDTRCPGSLVRARAARHHKPTHAERIRKNVGWLKDCFKKHGTLDAAVLDEFENIADELDEQ